MDQLGRSATAHVLAGSQVAWGRPIGADEINAAGAHEFVPREQARHCRRSVHR